MADEQQWTAQDKLASVERELRYRLRVYPRRVAEGKMSEQQMRREISIMEAIVADLRANAEKERLL
jgi:hypothetical protein